MSNLATYNAARRAASAELHAGILEALDRGDKWDVIMAEQGVGKATISRALRRRDAEGR